MYCACCCFAGAASSVQLSAQVLTSDTWDLGNLIINGSPVTSATVTAVLEVIYSTMQALAYESDNPATSSIPEFCNMLLFADAVECSKGITHKVADLLDTVVAPEFRIILAPDSVDNSGQNTQGNATGIQTQAAAASTAESADRAVFRFPKFFIDMDSYYTRRQGQSAVPAPLTCRKEDGTEFQQRLDNQQLQAVRQEVMKQLELLLYVSFKLELPELCGCISVLWQQCRRIPPAIQYPTP